MGLLSSHLDIVTKNTDPDQEVVVHGHIKEVVDQEQDIEAEASPAYMMSFL